LRRSKRAIAIAIALAIACGRARRVDLANGGSEIYLACKGAFAADVVRDALERAGETVDVEVVGKHIRIVTERFGELSSEAQRGAVRDALLSELRDRAIIKATWSGDRLYVRSKRSIAARDAAPIFAVHGLELVPHTRDATDDATGDHTAVLAAAGIDRMIQKLVVRVLGVSCEVVSFASVGPQRKQ